MNAKIKKKLEIFHYILLMGGYVNLPFTLGIKQCFYLLYVFCLIDHYLRKQSESQNTSLLEVFNQWTPYCKFYVEYDLLYSYNYKASPIIALFQRYYCKRKYPEVRETPLYYMAKDDKLATTFISEVEEAYPEETECVKKIVTALQSGIAYWKYEDRKGCHTRLGALALYDSSFEEDGHTYKGMFEEQDPDWGVPDEFDDMKYIPLKLLEEIFSQKFPLYNNIQEKIITVKDLNEKELAEEIPPMIGSVSELFQKDPDILDQESTLIVKKLGLGLF